MNKQIQTFISLFFNAFWKCLRLGNSLYRFLGVNVWSRDFFRVLLEVLGIFLGFGFCPHSIIPTWNPEYLPPQVNHKVVAETKKNIQRIIPKPDLQISRGGGGWGGSSQKNAFWPFRPRFGLKIRGAPGLPGLPLDPPGFLRCFNPPNSPPPQIKALESMKVKNNESSFV